MAEFLEVLETIKAEEASVEKIYRGEGQSLNLRRRNNARFKESVAHLTGLIRNLYERGYRSDIRKFEEAMTTDDFPYLFGDIIDRMLLQNYRETPQVYRNFCKVATVRDFRTVNRFTVSGGESVLTAVEQQAEYPESYLGEGKYYYSVKKYGRRMPFAWETMINDDLDALKDIPARFGKAARRTESKFATELYVDSSGPHASLYTSGTNQLTGNPVLSIASLQTAMTYFAAIKDSDGEPILIDPVYLVVPPALEITALNILNALQLELLEVGGTTNQKLIAANWMKNRVRLLVDWYIPIVATTNGNTSWFLFADPGNNRPALEVGFLMGHTEPEIFIKAPNARRIGGGEDPMNGDFDTDSIQYKIRHVLGGTRMDPKMTVASDGKGS